MRSAAIYHALTNELFSLRSPTGFELNLGGTDITSWESTIAEYGIKNIEKGDKPRKTKAIQLKEETSAVAPKRRVNPELEISDLSMVE